MRLRGGYLLAEALSALALAGLLAAAAAVSLGNARRALRAAEAREAATRAAREAVVITRRALLHGDAVVLRGDTAVDLDFQLGSAVLCHREARALLLPPPARDERPALTLMPQDPSAGDLVGLRLPDAADTADTWWYASVDSVQWQLGAADCGVLDGWRAGADAVRPVLRLVLAESLPPAVAAGAPVRLARRGRLALYRVGGGAWALGYRRCHAWLELCGPIQPVVAPLRAPAAGGFRIVEDSSQRAWSLTAAGHGASGTARASVPWP